MSAALDLSQRIAMIDQDQASVATASSAADDDGFHDAVSGSFSPTGHYLPVSPHRVDAAYKSAAMAQSQSSRGALSSATASPAPTETPRQASYGEVCTMLQRSEAKRLDLATRLRDAQEEVAALKERLAAAADKQSRATQVVRKAVSRARLMEDKAKAAEAAAKKEYMVELRRKDGELAALRQTCTNLRSTLKRIQRKPRSVPAPEPKPEHPTEPTPVSMAAAVAKAEAQVAQASPQRAVLADESATASLAAAIASAVTQAFRESPNAAPAGSNALPPAATPPAVAEPGPAPAATLPADFVPSPAPALAAAPPTVPLSASAAAARRSGGNPSPSLPTPPPMHITPPAAHRSPASPLRRAPPSTPPSTTTPALAATSPAAPLPPRSAHRRPREVGGVLFEPL